MPSKYFIYQYTEQWVHINNSCDHDNQLCIEFDPTIMCEILRHVVTRMWALITNIHTFNSIYYYMLFHTENSVFYHILFFVLILRCKFIQVQTVACASTTILTEFMFHQPYAYRAWVPWLLVATLRWDIVLFYDKTWYVCRRSYKPKHVQLLAWF